MKKPDYTLEEKARAFDDIWKNCGPGRGELDRYRAFNHRPIDENHASIERVPVYRFTIMYTGDCDTFHDVLHHLATKKEAPAGEDRGQGGKTKETTTKNESSV